MTPRAAAYGIGLLALFVLLGAGLVMIGKGVSRPALTGLFVGAALGGLNLALEAFSLSWALNRKPSALLLVSLGGFGLRLVLVSVLIVVFAGMSDRVNVVIFALAYVASFLAFLGLQVWAVSRMTSKVVSPAGDRAGEPEVRED